MLLRAALLVNVIVPLTGVAGATYWIVKIHPDDGGKVVGVAPFVQEIDAKLYGGVVDTDSEVSVSGAPPMLDSANDCVTVVPGVVALKPRLPTEKYATGALVEIRDGTTARNGESVTLIASESLTAGCGGPSVTVTFSVMSIETGDGVTDATTVMVIGTLALAAKLADPP